MLLELTGGGLSSYNLLLASSPCNAITLLFPAPGGRAQRGRTSATRELSPGRGGVLVGVQRGGLGGQRRRRKLGRFAAVCTAPAGVFHAGRLAGPRARSAAAPGSCAPFRGSRPRLGGCGLLVAGWAARERRANVPRRLLCPGERTARTSRAGRGRGGAPAAARTGGGRLPRGQPEVRAAQEAAGLFSSLPYFNQTAKPKWRVWGAVGQWGAKRVWGRARVVALTASLVPVVGNPPTGPPSSLPPSLPLPPPLNLLANPWAGEESLREDGERQKDSPRSGWTGARCPVIDCGRRAQEGA